MAYLLFSISSNPEFVSQLNNLKNNFSIEQPFKSDENLADESDIVSAYFLEAGLEGQTPLDLLVEDNEVEYDQYDFGVFVTSINGQSATNEYYWAVYINGEYAQQSSDQISLEVGDLVEWRFEEIQMQDE